MKTYDHEVTTYNQTEFWQKMKSFAPEVQHLIMLKSRHKMKPTVFKDQGLYMQQSNRKCKPRAEITPLVWLKPVTLNENLGPNVHTTSSAYTPFWDENLKPQGIYRLKF